MHHTQINRLRFALGIIAGAIWLSALPMAAQQQPPASAPASPSSSQAPAGNSTGVNTPSEQPGQNTLNKDRLFGVLPNYTTVETEHQFGPLTVKDKFKLTSDSMFDPVTFPFIGLEALIGQAENSEPEYGQGMEGYAKRYGTSYADAGIGTLMTTSVFPSMLHQDPRYFQLGRGSVLHRLFYSVSRMVITRNDDGSHGFNYSEIMGNAVAAGISNTYHPQQERTLSNTTSVWGTDIMWDAVSDVAKEFWPDIRRKIHKKKQQD